jgi:putative ABC transport system permease protein
MSWRAEIGRTLPGFGHHVPLAWRNLTANRIGLARSISVIAFAIVLMLIELGFRTAFLESALTLARHLDGELFILSDTKYRISRKAVFPRRLLYQARAIEGVESVRALYGEWLPALWKNPVDRSTFAVQVVAFDPDEPVLRMPEVEAHLAELRQPDTVLVDRRGRTFLGMAGATGETELAHRRVRILGSFALGPSFTEDGTVITGAQNFARLFPTAGTRPDVELGVVRLAAGADLATVQQRLQAELDGVRVMTRPQLLAFETAFQSTVSPVGPIFAIGTLIGFAIGMLISYQILHADLSEHLRQYATLKAMGYGSPYLVASVAQQAVLCGVAGFLPAWLVGLVLYRVIGDMALIPMRMTLGLTLLSLGLTVFMCLLSGLVAARRVLAADPAELF